MRSFLIASLALTAVLTPAVAKASSPATDSSSAQPVRVSTGVVAPELTAPISLDLPAELGTLPKPANGTVGLSVQVDAKGQVSNVKVTRSLSPFWDARIADAVARGHFRPATLDQTNIPLTVDLTVALSK